AQRAWWVRLSHERQARALVTAWTRREAYLKALGLGLSVPLEELEVSADPDEHPHVLDRARGGATDLLVDDLPVGSAWAAAIAHDRRRPCRLFLSPADVYPHAARAALI